jgi:GTP-binding protein
MKIKHVAFVGSFPKLALCPKGEVPEFAFIGRSNVGKSSLINMLCGQRVAHVSNTPGKTQTLNYFLINNSWHLVDLPGYGYAKVGRKLRDTFGEMVEEYLSQSPNLFCAFLLIDSCVPPQKIDLEFANWMGELGLPFALVFTKTDRKKVKRENERFFEDFKAAFLENWEALPPSFLSSAETGDGREFILDFIQEALDNNEQ